MIINALKHYGIDLVRIAQSLRGVPKYCRDYFKFRRVSPAGWPVTLRPYLSDFYESSGRVTVHYFKQDLFVAREIYRHKPQRHIDIGSRVDGFISHLAVFTEVEIIDIRPNHNLDPQIKFIQSDICDVSVDTIGATDSISCLHTIEHIGLGRYNDPIGADLWSDGLDRIFGLLRSGGRAYISMPVGRKRIEFNAHRVYDLPELVRYFLGKGKILKVALINDEDVLTEYTEAFTVSGLRTQHWKFGCAIFVIEK